MKRADWFSRFMGLAGDFATSSVGWALRGRSRCNILRLFARNAHAVTLSVGKIAGEAERRDGPAKRFCPPYKHAPRKKARRGFPAGRKSPVSIS
jgi:hypothetical protein